MPKIAYTFRAPSQFYLVEGMSALAVLGAVNTNVHGQARDLPDELADFDQLMRRYERLVLVTALRLLGRMEDAQDVAQEVFLKLYRHRQRLETPAATSAWLYRVTVNACHDLRRRAVRRVPVDDAVEVASTDADPHERSAASERRRALELSLRSLPEKERAALVLRDLEGLSTSEVARVLGSTEATVRSQVSKARVKVKSFVERYFRRRL
jgi:RNA polymerase sigma-70 factor (ECF subfamily)